MILNELLCYAIHHFSASAGNNLNTIILNFYEESEISDAKKVLWNACKDTLGEYPNRNGSPNRPAISAHIDDIMDAIKSLDIKKKMPNVVAKNLDRVPDRQPEELNQLFIIERLAKLENIFRAHDDSLSTMSIDVMQLKDNTRELKENLDSVSHICTSHITAASQDASSLTDIVIIQQSDIPPTNSSQATGPLNNVNVTAPASSPTPNSYTSASHFTAYLTKYTEK